MTKDAPMVNDEEFLRRWSRRKHAAQQATSTAADVAHTPDNPLAEKPLPTDADMPPIDTLTEASDYSGFLSPRVSEALRKQALRKLFHSPGFNVRDGLDDYDDDFTQFAKLGDIITADVKHQLELQAQRLEQLARDEARQQPDMEHTTPGLPPATPQHIENPDKDTITDAEADSA